MKLIEDPFWKHFGEEERCPECGERETCPAYDTGVLYPCPYYEGVTQKRSPDHLGDGEDCVTKGERT